MKPAPYTILAWKPITYPGVKRGLYQISTTGLVWSNIKNDYKYIRKDHFGYSDVTLMCEDNTSKTFRIHRLVAYEFCNPPENFMKLDVNHIDFNKMNNFNNNLEWVTRSENSLHSFDVGGIAHENIRNKPHGNRLTENEVEIICQAISNGKSYKEAIELAGLEYNTINRSAVCSIIKGYIWRRISFPYGFNYTEPKYSKSQVLLMIEQLNNGKSFREIYNSIFNDDYRCLSHAQKSRFDRFLCDLRNGYVYLEQFND